MIPIEWKISNNPPSSTCFSTEDITHSVVYEDALDFMQNQVKEISKNDRPSCVWFLQHPPLYTAGTSSKSCDTLGPLPFPVYTTGRGGQMTYHGPGQLVVYIMLNLKQCKCDVHWYVNRLEQWIINSLQEWNIEGYRKPGYPGIWVKSLDGKEENKIAAIGVRIQQWVTLHGISLNVNPDLNHFKHIVPCGIQHHGVTSLQEYGQLLSLIDVITVLKNHFTKIF